MPGNARRGAAPSITASAVNIPGAPCPTCPGGRAGPGGAYTFRESGPAAGQGAGFLAALVEDEAAPAADRGLS